MKLLVITSEPITADHLRDADRIRRSRRRRGAGDRPALHRSALRFWLSDADEAIARAQSVQQDSVDQLDSEGITAKGDTGESEPLAAIADTLRGISRATASRSSSTLAVRPVLPRNITAEGKSTESASACP
jgi:hypothetical protein